MSRIKILRFAVLATSVVAIVGATTVAPFSSAESSPLDSRSKIFKQYESLADYAESDGRDSRAWIPETGISKKAWNSAVEDESVRVDSQGHALYVDPLHVEHTSDGASPESATPVVDVPLMDAFLLNSLPGSNRTIYLDFTGHSLVDTVWQDRNQDGFDDYTDLQMEMPAYDVDGDTTTFSELERQNIIDAWSAIAEDYAPFSVNVTTQDPGIDALDRSDFSDTVFGVRALITDYANVIGSTCGCGGIAYVDVFDYAWNTYTGPALNFAYPWFSGKTISDVVSHEVGHNLGLSHDGGVNPPGTSVAGYYSGRDGWAPVMGVGYYQPLVQFSNGTYTSANNAQDDFAVVSGNGVDLRTDDYGDTRATASRLKLGTEKSGFISTRADVDYFSFIATAASHDVNVTSPSLSSNLDVQARLFRSNGTLFSTTNPDLFAASFGSATGLDAVFTATTTPGERYFIALDGVGAGSGTTTGYSDYGSLGEYRISVSYAPKTINPSGAVTISGTAKVAKTLSAQVTGWMKGVSWRYQWLRNGYNISAATSSKYKLTATDRGRQISVRLTVSKPGYPAVTVSSDVTISVAISQRSK